MPEITSFLIYRKRYELKQLPRKSSIIIGIAQLDAVDLFYLILDMKMLNPSFLFVY